MSKKIYGPKDREKMEEAENSTVINTDMPSDRFSGKAQVTSATENVTPASAVAGSGAKKDIVAKMAEEINNKVKVRPVASTEVLNDTQVGGVPIGSGQAVTRSAAGALNGVTTVVDSSKIPYTDGGYRPDSRFAKKNSDNDFLINNAISEQIAPKFEGSKDLRQNPGAEQGYNGHKVFKTARGKKNAGTVPQSILYDRSIDFMKIDSTIHTTGQVLDNIEDVAGYPTITALDNVNMDINTGYKYIENPMEKSNYLLKTFDITVKDGKITAFKFNEDKCVSHINPDNTYQANLNWQIDRNNVAKTVVALQKELGRETTDKWSPLGYVIQQPYEYNMLAHDIEATTGAIQAIAYRANNFSLAYQSNNKLAKDGAKPTTPVHEMFMEGIGQLSTSINPATYTGDFNKLVFNKDLYRQGSAAAIIAMFDSTGKYKTKANFFNLPRSLKYFIQTMDNNINPLHCKEEFLMALDTAHVYSTFDGNYNPLLPIVATDKVSIVNPLSLNRFLDGWSRDNVTSENRSGTASIYTYKYGDIRNTYSWTIKHPIVEGLLAWILKHEDAFVGTYLTDDEIKDGTEVTISLPCFFSMLAPSMFQCMLAAASQEVLWARNVYFRDFIFAGEQSEYIWKDLSSLSQLNPKFSSNFTLTDFKSPVKMGKMKPASFYHIYWGDGIQVAGADKTLVDEITLFAPWYFNEVSVKGEYTDKSGFVNMQGRPYTMSYPEVRLGVCHDYIDEIFAVSEKDLRLSLDRMVTLPVKYAAEEEQGNNTYAIRSTVSDINSNVKVRSLRYDKYSDGRVVMGYTNNDYVPTKASLMCAPRELGFLYSHLRVSPILVNVTATNSKVTFDKVGNYQLHAPLDGSMGYSLVCYAAQGNDVNSSSISRTAALQQDFCTIFADRSAALTDNALAIEKTGMFPALSLLFNNEKDPANITVSQKCVVSPFFTINGNTAVSDLPKTTGLITLSRGLWTMMNRFFMPVNVFENIDKTGEVSEGSLAASGTMIDPMEGCFMFGLAGFLASDFEQDVLDRADKYDMLQLEYTEDLFIKSSLVFRAN